MAEAATPVTLAENSSVATSEDVVQVKDPSDIPEIPGIPEIPPEAKTYISPEVQEILDAWRKEPKKTVDEMVEDAMKDISDEKIKESFAKMDKLQDELSEKIETMHTTFTEKIADIQADIEKFHEIDKERQKTQDKMNALLNEKRDDLLTSEEIAQMVEDFKAGKFKDGVARIEGKLSFRFGKEENGPALAAQNIARFGKGEDGAVAVAPSAASAIESNGTNGSPDTSTEDVPFDDAASTTSESSVVSESNPDGKKVKNPKSPKTSTGKQKGKAEEGKKPATKKKSSAKN